MMNDAHRITNSEIWGILADTKPAHPLAREAIMDAQDVRLMMSAVHRMNDSVMFCMEED